MAVDVEAVDQQTCAINEQVTPVPSPDSASGCVETGAASGSSELVSLSRPPTAEDKDATAEATDPCSVSEQQGRNESDPGHSSFLDFVAVPQRSTRRKTQNRKKMTNFNVTSDEHISFISDAESRTAKTANGKKRKEEKQSKADNGNLKQQKLVRSSARPKSAKESTSAGGKATGRDLCLYCSEAEDITKWVQCQKCEMWAHYECAGVDDNVFNWLCEFCD